MKEFLQAVGISLLLLAAIRLLFGPSPSPPPSVTSNEEMESMMNNASVGDTMMHEGRH